uniref:Secreted protein n=1 Tax=Lygus hesperus TaxID=30085 RepID=A0A0K8T889_LYGHE
MTKRSILVLLVVAVVLEAAPPERFLRQYNALIKAPYLGAPSSMCRNEVGQRPSKHQLCRCGYLRGLELYRWFCEWPRKAQRNRPSGIWRFNLKKKSGVNYKKPKFTGENQKRFS